MCGCVLRSEEGSEKQNNLSNLDEISHKTAFPNDKEKQAAPFSNYQIVHFTLTNLGGTLWSLLHLDDAPLAEEQERLPCIPTAESAMQSRRT